MVQLKKKITYQDQVIGIMVIQRKSFHFLLKSLLIRTKEMPRPLFLKDPSSSKFSDALELIIL